MKSKKHFRITLFADATAYCQDIVLIAAKQNSLKNPMPLQELFLSAKDDCREPNLIFQDIDGGFVIDVKLDNAIKPGLMIEEMDVYEMKKDIGELPDLGQSLNMLKISVELEAVKGDSLLANDIRGGLKKPNNLMGVISMIQSSANDNYLLVRDIVGEELLKDIMEVNTSETEDDIPAEMFNIN